jgi:diguanylate cyclase (GGDEF)-like protein
MTLDLRTVVVMLMLSAVLMAVSLAVGVRAGRSRGYGKWSAGLCFYALGWMLIAARGFVHPVVAVAAADAALLAGLCLQLAAVIEFGGRRVSRWLWIAPAPLLFAALLPILDRYALLTLVVSAAYAGALAAVAVAALRLGATAGPGRWLLASAYLPGALILVARALDIWLHPAQHTGIFAGGPLHAAAFIALFGMTVVSSVAFLLLHRERAEADLQRLALLDPLTGLYNRRAFADLAGRALAQAARNGTPCAALLMDLDHFKRVNDETGHAGGDRVLAAFAAFARDGLRAGDLLARHGGEEFCALLPETSLQAAAAVAERLRRALAARPIGGLDYAVTVSIGVTDCDPAAAHALVEAIARADAAMYRAKADGRDRIHVVASHAPRADRLRAAA